MKTRVNKLKRKNKRKRKAILKIKSNNRNMIKKQDGNQVHLRKKSKVLKLFEVCLKLESLIRCLIWNQKVRVRV